MEEEQATLGREGAGSSNYVLHRGTITSVRTTASRSQAANAGEDRVFDSVFVYPSTDVQTNPDH